LRGSFCFRSQRLRFADSAPGYFHATLNGDSDAAAVAHLSNATILQQIEQLVQDVEMQVAIQSCPKTVDRRADI
jgi:hypothetical protein